VFPPSKKHCSAFLRQPLENFETCTPFIVCYLPKRGQIFLSIEEEQSNVTVSLSFQPQYFFCNNWVCSSPCSTRGFVFLLPRQSTEAALICLTWYFSHRYWRPSTLPHICMDKHKYLTQFIKVIKTLIF